MSNSLLEELQGPPPVEEEAEVAPSGNLYGTGLTTSIESRAVVLLGNGVQPEAVANALGVVPARISQLLSQEEFAGQVATLRYENLQKHNVRDDKYNTLEDQLLDKLEKNLSLIFKPETLLRAIAIVNAAKRRGQSSPEQVSNHQNVVQIVLPSQVVQTFSTNTKNQVVKAGEQELLTMPSSKLLDRSEKLQEERLKSQEIEELSHEQESTTQ